MNEDSTKDKRKFALPLNINTKLQINRFPSVADNPPDWRNTSENEEPMSQYISGGNPVLPSPNKTNDNNPSANHSNLDISTIGHARNPSTEGLIAQQCIYTYI